MSALVLQTSFLGDVVLTTPLIGALAATGPVDVVTTPAGAAVLANNPGVRRLIVFDKRGADRGISGLRRVAAAVRANDRGDTAYCVQGSLRTATLAFIAGYRRRVGFDSSAGRWAYTRRVPFVRDQHHAERVLRLAVGAPTEMSPDALRPTLYPSPADFAAADALLQPAMRRHEVVIALAPGSIWGTKRWPYFAELARALATTGLLVIVGGPEDSTLAAGISAAAPGRVVDATGRLSLLGSAALIARSALLVTNDSAPQHLASAMGTPTLTLFGPTVPSFGFGPLAPISATAELHGLPCRPCDAHGPMTCPLGHHRCMRDLSPSAVLGRAQALLRPTASAG